MQLATLNVCVNFIQLSCICICQSRDCNLVEFRIADSTSRDSDRSFYQQSLRLGFLLVGSEFLPVETPIGVSTSRICNSTGELII